MHLDVLGGVPLEGALPRLLNEDQDREDLGGMQPGRSSPLTSAAAQQLALPLRLKALPKGSDGAKEIEYPHRDTSKRADGLW